jgi:hypothetical protein
MGEFKGETPDGQERIVGAMSDDKIQSDESIAPESITDETHPKHKKERTREGLLGRLLGDDHEESAETTPGRTASTAGGAGGGGEGR